MGYGLRAIWKVSWNLILCSCMHAFISKHQSIFIGHWFWVRPLPTPERAAEWKRGGKDVIVPTRESFLIYKLLLQTSVFGLTGNKGLMLKVTYCWVTVQPKPLKRIWPPSLGQGRLINRFTHLCCLPEVTQPAAPEHPLGARLCTVSRSAVANETKPCP